MRADSRPDSRVRGHGTSLARWLAVLIAKIRGAGASRAAASALVILSTAGSASAKEPRLEVGGYAGYMIGGSAEGQSSLEVYTGEIQEAPSYGGTIDFAVRPGAFVELSYARQETELTVRSTYAPGRRRACPRPHQRSARVPPPGVRSGRRVAARGSSHPPATSRAPRARNPRS